MIGKIKLYFKGVAAEYKKITWPTKKEIIKHTIVVIASIFILMTVFGGIDMGLSKILELIVARS